MQISYFPYITLKENQYIDFGDGFVVWHFYSLADRYIPDSQQREFIQRLLDTNVHGETRERISGISVVSIGATDFRVFNAEEELAVWEAKLILFLCKIAKTNTAILGSGGDAWTLSTSDNFEPVYQNFEFGNEHIAERAGYIMNLGSLGYTLNEKKFHKPSYVGLSPFGLSIDRELFDKLLRLRKRNGKRLFRRILRSTELLYQAYYNTTHVSRNARILLIAAEFEALLDLEEPARKNFKLKVEKYCDIEGERKYRYYYMQRSGRKKRDIDRSIKVLWGDAFFSLRNQIIHGDVVSENMYHFQDGDRHLDISVLFFCLLVKQLINEKFEPKPFLDHIEWGARQDGNTGFFYNDRSLAVALSRSLR